MANRKFAINLKRLILIKENESRVSLGNPFGERVAFGFGHTWRCWAVTVTYTIRVTVSFSSVAAASYLVDLASSRLFVSNIKPYMSKYKHYHSETANCSLNQLWFLRSYYPTWISMVILGLMHNIQL